jgi:PAS domain S-box-containing protein
LDKWPIFPLMAETPDAASAEAADEAANEAERLGALRRLGILDTAAEAEFDALARAASLACGVPISLLTLVDEHRQWFKANIGLEGVTETPRELAFCAHAIKGSALMEVPDATQDARFAHNTLVTGPPGIQFYAGAPIRLSNGHNVGTLCVIDLQPLQLNNTQREILCCLAKAAACAIEAWRAKHVQDQAARTLRDSEARLRQNEALLRRVSEVAGIDNWHYDLDTGAGFCSPGLYRIRGGDSSEPATIAAAIAFVAPSARPQFIAAIARAAAGEGGWDLELPLIRTDGTQIWVRSVGSADPYDDKAGDGKPAGISGTLQDITDRVNQFAALEKANERLSLATETCEVGIWEWQIPEDRTSFDARMHLLFGRRPEDAELDGRNWWLAVHPDDRAGLVQALDATVTTGVPLATEFRAVWPDGSVRLIQTSARAIRNAAGRIVRLSGVSWDVTESRAAETMRVARDAADRASRAKSDFLATMSHEIRSPLSGLLGVLELLRTTDLDDEQAKMAGMIQHSATMLMAVLNDVLDFSKIEAGAMSVSLAPTNPAELARALAEPYIVIARQKQLRFTLSIAPDVPAWIMTDGLRLRQIIGNLLSNATKFTAAGAIAFGMTVVETAGVPMLCVTVRDTGIGMPADVIERLFQPFSQADGSTTRTFGGTGLGLSIARNLARLLGGDLTVTSEAGEGSQFSLRLKLRPSAPPAGQASAPRPGTDQLSAIETAVPLRGRALVVDDDTTLRWLTQRQLAMLGFQVDIAVDGEAALQKLLTHPYDLLVTDCHMPRMTGQELAQAVRGQADPGLRGMPILGLTADVTEAQRILCQEAGMTELAIKPLTLEHLSQCLGRILGRILGPGGEARPGSGPAPALRAIAFDPQIYLSIFDRNDAEGAAWLEDFLASARRDAAALAAPDAALTAIAHRMAGAAFSAGAMLLGAAARALEQAAARDDRAAITAGRTAVRQEVAAAAAAIGDFLGQEAVLF